jgi:hypothetical protein
MATVARGTATVARARRWAGMLDPVARDPKGQGQVVVSKADGLSARPANHGPEKPLPVPRPAVLAIAFPAPADPREATGAGARIAAGPDGVAAAGTSRRSWTRPNPLRRPRHRWPPSRIRARPRLRKGPRPSPPRRRRRRTAHSLGRASASTATYCNHLAWSFARWRRCSSVEYVEYSPSSRLAIARNPRRHLVALRCGRGTRRLKPGASGGRAVAGFSGLTRGRAACLSVDRRVFNRRKQGWLAGVHHHVATAAGFEAQDRH